MPQLEPNCRRFIEDVAIQSMMGGALALVQIPEADRAKFIDRWTSDAADLAMKLHEKIENRVAAYELQLGVEAAERTRLLKEARKDQPSSSDFYTFDEALRQLNIDETRLKRLVSEGEIRCFREGDWLKFKKTEIDGLAGRYTR